MSITNLVSSQARPKILLKPLLKLLHQQEPQQGGGQTQDLTNRPQSGQAGVSMPKTKRWDPIFDILARSIRLVIRSLRSGYGW